jgi:hypothetical protein
MTGHEDQVWTTADGTTIPISAMTPLHARNALRMIHRANPPEAQDMLRLIGPIDAMSDERVRHALRFYVSTQDDDEGLPDGAAYLYGDLPDGIFYP